MAEATTRKQEKDFTEQVDQLVPASEARAEAGQVDGAVEDLVGLEKLTRNAADLSSTTRILLAIVSILYKARRLDQLRLEILTLSRKHGQLRQATTRMVEEAMKYVEEMSGAEKIALIETLREVTEGKIFVEVPRARLTRQLAAIREADGDVAGASALMQDLQVETFGSMDRREKIDFILEQMRLLRLNGEWEKVAIVSKKINLKWLAEEPNEDLRIRFYDLLISYGLHTSRYLDLCKYYRAIYEAPSVKADEAKRSAALRNAVFFVLLTPFDNEQNDLLNRIANDDNLQKLEGLPDMVKCFNATELMRWPGVERLYGPWLRQTRVFGPAGVSGFSGDIEVEAEPQGEKRWGELKDRIVERNVRVVAQYYTRLSLTRLGELLDLGASDAEKVLARLVTSKVVYARIDRLAGVVNFEPVQSTADVLNAWNGDVARLLDLVEKTSHLIAKDILNGMRVH